MLRKQLFINYMKEKAMNNNMGCSIQGMYMLLKTLDLAYISTIHLGFENLTESE